MTRQRAELFAFSALVLVVVAATFFFTWPNYAKGNALHEEMRGLSDKIGHLEDAERDVAFRRAALEQLREDHADACRNVPDRPDVANLMNHLSIGVDGVTVLDQTFTVRGTPDTAADDRFEILPLVVELETSFGHTFDVIRRVEALDRLVRVRSVRMEGDMETLNDQSAMIKTSVGLDVVYEHSGVGKSND
jgi:Tfp pilus assembly protein PilO